MSKDTKELLPEAEMTIMSHLSELRTRLIRSVLAIVAGVIIVWIFFEPIFGFLKRPYCDYKANQASGGGSQPLADNVDECSFLITEITEGFTTQLSLSGWGGVILAMPVILYQLARFVMPGLYPGERRALLSFIPISIALMFTGMSMAYFLMPKAIEVLLGFGDDSFNALLSPKKYVSFFIKMLFAFGVSFQLPVVLVFLQKIGIVKPETLRNNRRYAIVAVIVAGAIITPTGDPFNLAAISIPMYLFYEISIFIGTRIRTKKIEVGPTAE